jgi:hypothetical protein
MEADLQDGRHRAVTMAGGGALCPLADLSDGVPRGLTAATGDGPLSSW